MGSLSSLETLHYLFFSTFVSMRITFLIDNLPHPTLPLLTEHGLSMYIEWTNRRIGESTNRKIGILCDMGASGAFMKNAQALGVDLEACHLAFLSHGHADHTGGLGKWIAQYGHIPVYASNRIATDEYFSSRPKKVASQKSQVKSQCKVSAEASLLDYAEPQPDFMSEANKDQCKVSAEASPSQSELRYIGPDLNLFRGHTPWFKPIEQSQWFTPTIAMVFPTCSNYPTPLGNKYLYTDESTNRRIGDFLGPSTSSGTVKDDFSHEIALAFVTEKGLVVVSSCSHKGALNTIQSCMEFTGCNALHAYVGGLHFVDSEEVIKETTDFINEWLRLYPNAQLYTGHCTCPHAASLLQQHLPLCEIFHTGYQVDIT